MKYGYIGILPSNVRHDSRLKPMQKILGKLNDGSRVLDVGCGSGFTIFKSTPEGKKVDVHGIEIEKHLIDYAKKRHPDYSFKVGPAEKLPYKDKMFDSITYLDVIEHVQDPIQSLKEVHRALKDDGFVDMVKETLSYLQFDPDRLELEITESIMQDFEKSTKVLNKLKKLGVIISMDDFGTGYSSLNNLRHLPIDSIKIDKSFVDDIMEDSNQVSIVKAIIDMSQNMNFTTIAEGIETENQVLFLKRNACQVGQGYHFSRPLTGPLLEKFLVEWGREHSERVWL